MNILKSIQLGLYRLAANEEGATAIEYAVIAGLISVAIITVLSGDTGLGKTLANFFTTITGKIPTGN